MISHQIGHFIASKKGRTYPAKNNPKQMNSR